jgi:hypothetical protein
MRCGRVLLHALSPLGPEEVGEVGLGNGSDERLVLLLRGHQ